MKMTKSWISAISGLAALSLVLVACSSGSGTKSETTAAPANSQAATSTVDLKDKYKGQTLNLLTWEGYADKKFVKGFEDKFGVKVNTNYIGSSDELVAKLKVGGGNIYDVISPSTDVASTIVQSDLVEPIDTSKLSHFSELNARLKQVPEVKKDGKVYGLPFTWGPSYLIYDSDVIKEEPKSWDIMWDPQYKGKVAIWDEISSLYIIGQMDGLDKTDPSALYNMTEAQLQSAKDKLLQLKPQIRKYWATAGELNDLFANKEIVLAVGWPITVKEVNSKGRHLKGVIPSEGATGWIDHLMIVKGTKHRELADQYLDYISSPEAMALVADVNSLSVSNPNASKFMSKDLQEVTGINDMDKMFSKLNLWQNVKNRERYNEVWTEIKTN